MNTYTVSVLIKVEVEAFDEGDALDAVHDCYGEGEACGMNILQYEVIAHDTKSN